MVVKELVMALLKCKDQGAKVFYGDDEITGCSDMKWSEGATHMLDIPFDGKGLVNRVELYSTPNYEEGGYGQAA